jgi:hypothetical protein
MRSFAILSGVLRVATVSFVFPCTPARVGGTSSIICATHPGRESTHGRSMNGFVIYINDC